MLTLREKRIEFSKCIAALVLWANEQGMEVCFDRDGLKHMANSLHYIGLAKDLICYRGGEYLTSTEDYRELGDMWKSMHPLARWGGDFPDDGGHFSFEHNGVK